MGVGLLLFASMLVFAVVGVAPMARAQGDPTVTVAPQKIDSGQAATLTANVTGLTPGTTYTLTWLPTVSGSCGTPPLQSGPSDTYTTGPLSSNTAYCVILNAGSQGTASAMVNVTVNPALVAPVVSVSQATVPSGQSANLNTTTPFSGGTSFFVSQWLEEAPGGGWVNLGTPFTSTAPSSPSTSTGALSSPGTWYFDLTVTDSSQTPEKVTSNIVSVTVASTSSSSSSSTSSGSSSSSSSSSSSGLSSSSSSSSQTSSANPTNGNVNPILLGALVAVLVIVGAAVAFWQRGRIFGGTKPTEGPPPPGPTGQSAAPDPCAEVLKAYNDAMDERSANPTPEAYTKEREARAKYLECLSKGKGYTDPWWHGGIEKPNTPPAPPATPPSPSAPPQPAGATPPFVPLPRTKEKQPCPDGWVPETVQVCGDEVDLVLVEAATIETNNFYQFSEEDVEKAIKGLEIFLKVAGIASKVQGALTEPAELVSAGVEGITTDGAADAALDGIKKLMKKVEKVKKAGEWKVIFPIEKFGFKCEETKECRDGDWVVTKRQFTFWDTGKPGTPPTYTYDSQSQRSGDSLQLPEEEEKVLRLARSVAQRKNDSANAKIEKCRKLCQ